MLSAGEVRAQFDALMLEPMLKPLESAFGDYGELATQGFAKALTLEFERES